MCRASHLTYTGLRIFIRFDIIYSVCEAGHELALRCALGVPRHMRRFSFVQQDPVTVNRATAVPSFISVSPIIVCIDVGIYIPQFPEPSAGKSIISGPESSRIPSTIRVVPDYQVATTTNPEILSRAGMRPECVISL